MQLGQFVGTSSRSMRLSSRGRERAPRGGQRATRQQHGAVLQHLPVPQLHRKNNPVRSQGGRLSPGLQSVRLTSLPRPARRTLVSNFNPRSRFTRTETKHLRLYSEKPG